VRDSFFEEGDVPAVSLRMLAAGETITCDACDHELASHAAVGCFGDDFSCGCVHNREDIMRSFNRTKPSRMR
jgi:hypothetical protein